jgi:uncharacterized delta-60 repeat protein
MKTVFLLFLLMFFTACQTNPTLPTKNLLGLLEVRLDLEGNTASARLVNPASTGLVNPLTTQALTAYNLYNSNTLAFLRQQVRFVDDNDFAATNDIYTTGATRYISATFDVINSTGIDFENLILHAVSLPGTTVGGTAFSVVQRGDGSLETAPSVVQQILPATTMGFIPTGIAPTFGLGDLQWLTDNESGELETQASLVNLPTPMYALDYGFAVRTRTANTRSFASGATGKVTLAYKLPKINPRNANPFGFVIYYAITNQTQRYSSQSVEEQGTTLHNTTAITDGVRVVSGSRLIEREDLVPVNCNRIRIARPDNTQNTTVFYPLGDYVVNQPNQPSCTFGASGRRSTRFGINTDDSANAVVNIPISGGYYVVGTTNAGSHNDFAIWKVTAAGKTDLGFGTAGKVVIDFAGGSDDQAKAVALDSSGRILVAGSSGTDFGIVRLNTNGSLSTSFSTDGKQTINFGATDSATGIAVDGAGNIVVAGYTDNGAANFAVARLTNLGALDTTLNDTGFIPGTLTENFGGADFATSMGIDHTGRILVAGYTNASGNNDMAVLCLSSSGRVCSGFGTFGKQTVSFGGDDRAWAMAIYPNSSDPTNVGKIVLAGQWDGSQSDFAIARLNTTGTLDNAFGGGGKFNASFGNGSQEWARGVAINGTQIHVGGYTNAGANPDNFALLRLTDNGTLDTGFDGDGQAIYDFQNSDDEATALSLSPYGELGMVGVRRNNDDFLIIELEVQ